MRVIVLFNLKPGTDARLYEEWARANDIPRVNALESVSEFSVYRATGLLGHDGKPPYQYIEIIDVDDLGRFGIEAASETVQNLARQFRQFADDPAFILTDQL